MVSCKQCLFNSYLIFSLQFSYSDFFILMHLQYICCGVTSIFTSGIFSYWEFLPSRIVRWSLGKDDQFFRVFVKKQLEIALLKGQKDDTSSSINFFKLKK